MLKYIWLTLPCCSWHHTRSASITAIYAIKYAHMLTCYPPHIPPQGGQGGEYSCLRWGGSQNTVSGQPGAIQAIRSGQVNHQELGHTNPIHQMGRIAHTKRNLVNTKFSMVTVACMFESFNETSSQWSIVKRKFVWLFCLSSIVISNPSDRRRGHAYYPIIPKFKMNGSSLLKSANVTEFRLLVRNPSAASAITMDSQWAVGSGTVFCAGIEEQPP